MRRTSTPFVFFSLASWALACAPVRSPSEPSAEPHVAPEAEVVLRLAHELDPGPSEPLVEALDAEVHAEVSATIAPFKTVAEKLDAARVRLRTVETWARTQAETSWVVEEASLPLASLFEGLLLLEPLIFRAPAEGPERVVSERAEAAVLLSGLYRQVSSVPILGSLQNVGAPLATGAKASPIRALWATVGQRAPTLLRALAAQSLRQTAASHAVSAQAAQVLAELCEAEIDAERFERARDLAGHVRRLVGSSASAKAHLAMARANFHVLALADGQAALASARGLALPEPESFHQAMVLAEELQRHAEQLSALASRADVDTRLRRARLLLDMGHLRQSQEQYRVLHAEYPTDARAATGLARSMLEATLQRKPGPSFAEVAALLDDPRLTAHREREYFDLSVELQSFLLAQGWESAMQQGPVGLQTLAAAAERVAARARALEPYDVARATALHYFMNTSAELLRLGTAGELAKVMARARQTAEETRLLRRRFPDSPEVARLALAATFFAEDERAAFEVLDAPWPAALRADPQATFHHALMRLGMIATFRAKTRLPQTRQLLRELGASPGIKALDRATLDADYRALAATFGEGTWQEAAEGYSSAINFAPGQEQYRLISNATMALMHYDADPAFARSAWSRIASKSGEDAPIPTLCLASVEPDPERAATLLEGLPKVDSSGIRVLTLAWQASGARRRGASANARTLAALWSEQMARLSPTRRVLASGDDGLAMTRELQLVLPPRSRGPYLRFAHTVALRPLLWLVPAAPLDSRAMAALAAGH